ncbi:hypothetical protein BJ742DRAFT_855000 [Cladochytrium replicatum]|nr:hypothetical protein BJ742DRAFT_855000 [Cladochytrium replicatum]
MEKDWLRLLEICCSAWACRWALLLAWIATGSLVLADQRIAIVGAGAAGSFAAYYLAQVLPSAKITVYESSDRAGGRAYAEEIPIGNNKAVTVELGASIIAKANFLLLQAARDLKLTAVDSNWCELDPENSTESSDPRAGSLGIWIEHSWSFILSGPNRALLDYQRKIRPGLANKYGMKNGMGDAVGLVYQSVGRFLQEYGAGPFLSVTDLVERAQIGDLSTTIAEDFFVNVNKINKVFVREFLAGITLNTYTQKVDQISAWPASIALFSAIAELSKIRGGNYRLFDAMLDASNGTIQYSTPVTRITASQTLGSPYTITTANGTTASYDAVIVAAPLSGSILIELPSNLEPMEPLNFVQVYVTVVVGIINPGYFKLQSADDIPSFVLIPSTSSPFNSLSILARVPSTDPRRPGNCVVKLFSSSELQPSDLASLFTSVDYSTKKVWNAPGAYPDLSPSNANADLRYRNCTGIVSDRKYGSVDQHDGNASVFSESICYFKGLVYKISLRDRFGNALFGLPFARYFEL